MDKKEEIHSPLTSKKGTDADEGIGERDALQESATNARETLKKYLDELDKTKNQQ